jgi:hypothetical protein
MPGRAAENGGRMGLIVTILAALVLSSGGLYYGYQAGFYDVRRLGGGRFVIVIVLMMFFVLSSTS